MHKYLKLFFNRDNFTQGLFIFAIIWLLTVVLRELVFLIKIDELIWSAVGVFLVFLIGFMFNRFVKLLHRNRQ